jgi:hypothetical protein
MSQMEIVYAKKCAIATKDWDTFQAIIRTCLKPLRIERFIKKNKPRILPQSCKKKMAKS